MRTTDAIAHILKREGVEYLSAYPTTPVIDAAAKAGIRPIICRQERVGVGIADGYTRVKSGRPPGVFAMQYGPGAENAFAGVATRSLVDTWGLVEQRGKRGDTRYTLSAEGIRYVTHRDRAQLPTTQGIWSTALTTDKQGRRRHVGHRIETWARQTKHADGITWFLSKLEAEARDDPDSELQWSVPTARSDRAYNWGDSAIAPDAVGRMTAQGLRIPFYFEYELRARHPQGVIARLDPYESYYWSNEHKEDQPPYPVTLFVVDTEEVLLFYDYVSS